MRWKLWGRRTSLPPCVHRRWRVCERECGTTAGRAAQTKSSIVSVATHTPPPHVPRRLATQDNTNLRPNKRRWGLLWRRFSVFLLCFTTFLYNLTFLLLPFLSKECPHSDFYNSSYFGVFGSFPAACLFRAAACSAQPRITSAIMTLERILFPVLFNQVVGRGIHNSGWTNIPAIYLEI